MPVLNLKKHDGLCGFKGKGKTVQLPTSGMTLPTGWDSLVEEIIPDLLLCAKIQIDTV